MRLRRFTFAFPLAALAGFVIAGCPDDKTLLHPEDVPDATTADTGTDTGTDAGEQKALVRFAHLAPVGTTKIDVCLRPVAAADAGPGDAGEDAGDAGTTDAGPAPFVGPVLQILPNGIPEGIGYKDVTKYFDVTGLAGAIPSGNVEIRIVPGAGTDCNTALPGTAPIFTTLPAIQPGTTRTIAALFTGSALQVAVLNDHLAALDATKADVRFFNGAVSGAPNTFDFTVGANPGATGVAFGSTVSTNDGYVAFDPLNAQAISGRPSGASAAAFTVEGVTAAANSVTSVFAIGAPGAAPYAGLVCKDSAPAIGNFTDCGQVVPGDGGTDAGDSGTDAGDAGDAGDSGP
ncbi:hypothetical protein LZC95_36600 [Pendulispora brunnea]|uniref:DUF4397 domain-containing protein n=1 Tax=Pendulispora brunnea TaxID=2905690 RepID=A0ABZ2K3M8_9BACT